MAEAEVVTDEVAAQWEELERGRERPNPRIARLLSDRRARTEALELAVEEVKLLRRFLRDVDRDPQVNYADDAKEEWARRWDGIREFLTAAARLGIGEDS